MNANLVRLASRLLLGAGLGVTLWLAGNAITASQEVPPPAPDAKSGTGEAAKNATEGVEGATKVPGSSKEQDAGSAKEPSDPFADPAPKTETKPRRGEAGDAPQEPQEGKEATRDAAEAAPNAAEDARERTREAIREGRENLRDQRDALRDAGREPRADGGQPRAEERDRGRDSRAGRDLPADASETLRDERDGLRDGRDDFPSRESSRTRQDDRDSREESLDAREFRGSDRSSRESFRGAARTEASVRTENLRSADLGLWFSRGSGQGLVISDIATSGPLATIISRIGFREGDEIISVDGYRVTRDEDFVRRLLADEVLYERVPVVLLRDGRRTTLYVEPIQLAEHAQTVRHDPLEQFGIILDDRSPDRVLVWRVVPRSPAFYAGIKPGDVITTFHGRRVASPDDLVQLVESAEPGMISVEVNRNQRMRQLDVEFSALEGRAAARTAMRPEYDDPSIERLSERREERIEGRQQMRMDGAYVAPPTYAPAAGPVRRLLFPRLRY